MLSTLGSIASQMAEYVYAKYSAQLTYDYSSGTYYATDNTEGYANWMAIPLANSYTYYDSVYYSSLGGYVGVGPQTVNAGSNPPIGKWFIGNNNLQASAFQVTTGVVLTWGGHYKYNARAYINPPGGAFPQVYVAGSYMGIVKTSELIYPSNGRHVDGYWYIRQS